MDHLPVIHRFERTQLCPNPNGRPHVEWLWNRLAGLLYRRAWLDAHDRSIEEVNAEIHRTRLRLLRQGVPPLEMEWHVADIDDEARQGVSQVLGEDE